MPDKTSEEQFDEMKSCLGESAKEAVAADQVEPKASIAYAAIIDATKGVSESQDDGERVRRRHQDVPLSLSIRSILMTPFGRGGVDH